MVESSSSCGLAIDYTPVGIQCTTVDLVSMPTGVVC